MQSFNFSLTNAKSTVINQGTLFTAKLKSKIVFSEHINETFSLDLDAININDKANFVASIVRRLDKDNVYTQVLFNDSKDSVNVIREEKNANTMAVYVKKDKGNGFIAIAEPNIKIPTLNDGIVTISAEDMGFKKVIVPIDFKYVKNPVLNALYKDAVVPFDYNTALSKTILKEIRRNTDKKDWSFSIDFKYPSRIYGGGLAKEYGIVKVTSDRIRELENKFGVSL
jgi:hypothetical protein